MRAYPLAAHEWKQGGDYLLYYDAYDARSGCSFISGFFGSWYTEKSGSIVAQPIRWHNLNRDIKLDNI